MTNVRADTDSTEVEAGKCAWSAYRKASLERERITVEPAANDEPRIQLSLGRDAIVFPDVEKNSSVFDVRLEVSDTVLISSVEKPTRPWIQDRIARVEQEMRLEDVHRSIVHRWIYSPISRAAKQSYYVARAA